MKKISLNSIFQNVEAQIAKSSIQEVSRAFMPFRTNRFRESFLGYCDQNWTHFASIVNKKRITIHVSGAIRDSFYQDESKFIVHHNSYSNITFV